MNEHTTINPTTGEDQVLLERQAKNREFWARIDNLRKAPRKDSWDEHIDLSPIRR